MPRMRDSRLGREIDETLGVVSRDSDMDEHAGESEGLEHSVRGPW